jgi:S-adenosylmethionine decarboxylase
MNNLFYQYKQSEAWGLSTSIDLHSCNRDTIRDSSKIEQFVVELCELIKMKRFGECKVVHFGEDEEVAGFSMTQLIETSLISGHFANKTNNAYIDIFSCRYYEPKIVADFAKKFFNAQYYKVSYVLRK